MAMPSISLITLDSFPTRRGMAASLQGFVSGMVQHAHRRIIAPAALPRHPLARDRHGRDARRRARELVRVPGMARRKAAEPEPINEALTQRLAVGLAREREQYQRSDSPREGRRERPLERR